MSREARVDGCPECASSYQTPEKTRPDGPDGFVAHYKCGACGHEWDTTWRDR